jgi:acid phosphatase
VFGYDQGYYKLALWQDKFAKPIAHRLSTESSGLAFSSLEIYSMMEMCGFEVLARGHSPWCEVFPKKEGLDFEYARDLLHFYRVGPGNKYSSAMGWLWLNAPLGLLSQASTDAVYFSFVHDNDTISLLTALGIYSSDHLLGRGEIRADVGEVSNLPTDRIVANREWRTSDLMSMGGRIIIERLRGEESGGVDQSQAYIRLIINDGSVAIRDSSHGSLATLRSFQQLLRDRGKGSAGFQENGWT